VPAAVAHVPTRVVFAAPAAGEVIRGSTVSVRLEGNGGLAPASFRLLLDGAVLDDQGRPSGSLFTNQTLAPGGTRRYDVPLARPGDHELRVIYAADADSNTPDAVLRFRSVESAGGFGHWPLAIGGGAAVLLAVALYVALRRRRSPRSAG
jgi:hypothetical protein